METVAILKCGGIGDSIAILPALDALRTHFAMAKMYLLTNPLLRDLYASRPSYVDEIIIVPPYYGVRPGVEDWKEQDSFFRKMRQLEFDLVLQLHGGGANSNPFTLNLGAKRTAGYATPDAQKLDIWTPYVFYHNERDRPLNLLSRMDIPVTTITPKLEVTKLDIAMAKKVLGTNGKYIVIHPGASEEKRRWPAERFANVGDYFANLGYTVVITGTEIERKNVFTTAQRMRKTPVVAINELPIWGLVGLIKGASLLVSNDSGPMHIGGAVGTPTVGIMWGPNQIQWAFWDKSYLRIVPSWIVNCPLCGASVVEDKPVDNGCDHYRANYVVGAAVEQVITACKQLLLDNP